MTTPSQDTAQAHWQHWLALPAHAPRDPLERHAARHRVHADARPRDRDRREIADGLRADPMRSREDDGHPLVREVVSRTSAPR